MSLSPGDDFQETPPSEVELEAAPRAERPNFLTATRFVDFDLPTDIMEGLDKAGFEYCTPIQAQAIPVAMNNLDIAGQAQTGTGKTTAFLVPLLNRLLTGKPIEPGLPRALIVTPTRELALQIHEDALVLAGATNLRQALVIGGMDYKEQADLLATGPEIVICTPGRIIDYLRQGVFKTRSIEVAVVDEADRLLDMGFIKDLKYLLGHLPPFNQRQTMLFSATLDERVLELTYQFMNPPQYITAEPDKTTKVNIEQELYHVGREEKLTLLMGLLRREEHRRVIIFANTKSGVEWLAKKLTLNGFQAEGITGDLPQPKRLKLMDAFKENRLQILVATDVASRGIHVDDVSHVYNYDLPQDAENYIHRIGRTARAGHSGKAVTFGCEDYIFHLEAIENLLGEKIPVFWAEQEWYQEDQAGEVRLKDRRADQRKGDSRGRPRSGDRTADREGRDREGGGDRRTHGPARSRRPGGIFGLSPRASDSSGPDVRQALSWAAPGGGSAPLEEATEIIEEAAPAAAAESSSEREARPEKRRRRRRSRRGREAAPPAGEPPVAARAEAPQAASVLPEEAEAGAELSSEPASLAPAAEAAQPETKPPARKPRRPTTSKTSKAAVAVAPPEAEEAPAKTRRTTKKAEEPDGGQIQETSPNPKPRRTTKKAAAAATADPAAAPEAPPAKRGTRKVAETKSEAAPAPKASRARKTVAPAETKTPARSRAAKKTAEES